MSSDEVEEMHAKHNGDDAIISNGWSITIGELKKAISEIPDDYEVMLCNAEVEDIEISNVNIEAIYPPALGSPGILRLGGGQILNSEYAYDERMDVHHAIGGDKWWNSSKQEWKTH